MSRVAEIQDVPRPTRVKWLALATDYPQAHIYPGSGPLETPAGHVGRLSRFSHAKHCATSQYQEQFLCREHFPEPDQTLLLSPAKVGFEERTEGAARSKLVSLYMLLPSTGLRMMTIA